MQAIELIRACPKKTLCLICRGVMQAMRKSKSSDIDRNILLNINIKIACKEALISKNKNDWQGRRETFKVANYDVLKTV